MTSVSSSTGAFYDRARTQLSSLTAQNEKLQTQVSTGERLTKSSDDPLAASRLRKLAREDALSEIDKSNASRANSDLSLADSTMSDISDQIIRAQSLATQAASDTLSDEQRKSIGAELEEIHSTLVSLANTKDSGGNALFGGEGAAEAYTLDASGNAVYSGTANSGEVSLGQGQSVTRSMTGPEMLSYTDANGNQTDILATIKSLADALQGGATDPTGAANDALADLETGLDTLTTAQTVVGTRMSWIELTNERRTTQSEARETEKSEVGDVDLATTITELQEAATVLEAAQSAFTKLSGLSLFDKL